VCAFVLVLAVQVAALAAPLVHVHLEAHDGDHHGARAIHTHWDGHASSHHHPAGTPAVAAADDDRPFFLDVFTAVTATSGPLPALVAAGFVVAVPSEAKAFRTIDRVRIHDPPTARPAASRAPPTA
jgi:hypothetical protein